MRSQWCWRQWQRLPWRGPRISGQPSHPHLPFVDGVVRRQVVVADRPVDGDTVEAAHAEVGRREAPEVAGVADRATANRVVDEDADRVVTIAGDWVVRRPLSNVWTRR